MKSFFLLLGVSLTFFSVAQNRTITGKIINDANEPLGFAKIAVKSPKGNALSAVDGTFSLVLKDTASANVTISVYGYQPQEMSIGSGPQELTIVMKPTVSENSSR